jgi:TolB-like protein
LSLLKRKSSLPDTSQGFDSADTIRDGGRKVVAFSPVTPHVDSSDPIFFHLNKVLNSKALAGSAALKKLLQHLVTKVLRSEQHQIKEYSLGVEVFCRSDSFDPYVDTIVRVQVRRLRQKLRQYYNTEGIGDMIHIEIPKGSYIPVFIHSFVDRPCQDEPSIRCRLAVLPFVALNQDNDCQMFADGLTETLIDDFAKSGNLDVVSRTSSFTFKEHHKDIRLIAKHLRVDAIVEGSIQRFDHQFRTKIRLINAKTGFAVWSSSLDVDANNILKGEEEISRSVTPIVKALLSTALNPGEKRQ